MSSVHHCLDDKTECTDHKVTEASAPCPLHEHRNQHEKLDFGNEGQHKEEEAEQAIYLCKEAVVYDTRLRLALPYSTSYKEPRALRALWLLGCLSQLEEVLCKLSVQPCQKVMDLR
jgi:hypothetical protein